MALTMTHQQASIFAWIKRLAGIVIFLCALISTVISLLKFTTLPRKNLQELSETIVDILRMVVNMFKLYTPFLNTFWNSSPIPVFGHWSYTGSVMFIIIFLLMFVGLAIAASGARLSQRAYDVREGIIVRASLEAMNGSEAKTRQALEEGVRVPNTSTFAQIGQLYVAPVFWGIFIYFLIYMVNQL